MIWDALYHSSADYLSEILNMEYFYETVKRKNYLNFFTLFYACLLGHSTVNVYCSQEIFFMSEVNLKYFKKNISLNTAVKMSKKGSLLTS